LCLLAAICGLLVVLSLLLLLDPPPTVIPRTHLAPLSGSGLGEHRSGQDSGPPGVRESAPALPIREVIRLEVIDALTSEALPDAVLRRSPRKRLAADSSFVTIARAFPDGVIEAPIDVVLPPSGPPAASSLSVTCDGYSPVWLDPHDLAQSPTTQIRLVPGSTVTVRVVAAGSGSPVDAAIVGISSGSSPIDLATLLNPSQETRAALPRLVSAYENGFLALGATDAEGIAVFRNVPPGEIGAAAFKAGLWRTAAMGRTPSASHSITVHPRSRATMQIELSPLYLAVAVADPSIDVVAVSAETSGLHWGVVTASAALDDIVRSRFPGSIFHYYGLRTTAEPSARIRVFAENVGWVTQELAFRPFEDAVPTIVRAPDDPPGGSSGRVQVDFVATDGTPIPAAQCLLQGTGCPSVRIPMHTAARVPPGRYSVVPHTLPWLSQRIQSSVTVDVPASGLVHCRVVADIRAVRATILIDTFDDEPATAIRIRVFHASTQETIANATTARQRIELLLPWGPDAEEYQVVASSFDLRGSAVVTTGGATMPTEPITARIELAPRARRQ
jgi:hypothetical protein